MPTFSLNEVATTYLHAEQYVSTEILST